MFLETYEKLTFTLLSKVFFYLWPLSVKWNRNHSEIVLNVKPRLKFLPFLISVLYLVLLGAGCITITVVHMNFIFRRDFGRLNAATLLMVASSFFVATGFISKAATEARSIIAGCNGIFKLYVRLRKGK